MPVMKENGARRVCEAFDGNKDVSELVFFRQANGVAAHYEYAPFGGVTATNSATTVTSHDFIALNPLRFSSEFADSTIGLVYYNYRHYEPTMGRWLTREPIEEEGGENLYRFRDNDCVRNIDQLENQCCVRIWDGIPGHMALKCDNGLYVSKYPDRKKLTSRPPKHLDENADIAKNGNNYTDICMTCVDENKSKKWWSTHQSENYSWMDASCIEAALGALAAGIDDEEKPPCKCKTIYALLGFFPYIKDNLSREIGIVPYSISNARLAERQIAKILQGMQTIRMCLSKCKRL